MSAGFECIRYEVADHVVTITLNRPERRNALNRLAYNEIETAFQQAAADPVARCVIVTGADPAFCSGEDVREVMAAPKAETTRAPFVRHPPTPAAMAALECDKPVIAAVHGAAMGWGMELALYADIRLASEHASFAELFIKRGSCATLAALPVCLASWARPRRRSSCSPATRSMRRKRCGSAW
jgi:enoyl-CoA hydratase/carnithine racemase